MWKPINTYQEGGKPVDIYFERCGLRIVDAYRRGGEWYCADQSSGGEEASIEDIFERTFGFIYAMSDTRPDDYLPNPTHWQEITLPEHKPSAKRP